MPLFKERPQDTIIAVRVPIRDDDLDGWQQIMDFYEVIAEQFPEYPLVTLADAMRDMPRGDWLYRGPSQGAVNRISDRELNRLYYQISA